MSTRRIWKPEEERLLAILYPDFTAASLALTFDRPVGQIYQKADRMSLEKSATFYASAEAQRFNGRKGGQTRFKKGHRTWNAGLKGWKSGGRSAQTQFKPGIRPHTWQPVGTEVRDPDGYLKRKVSDSATAGNSRHNWKFVHVLLWEQHNGAVPPGHAVVFRDGNRQRIEIDNLELVSRTELMRRNTVHNLPEEIKSVITARARLVRVINEVSREKQG